MCHAGLVETRFPSQRLQRSRRADLGDRNGVGHGVDIASAGARRHRERRVAAIAVSTRDQSQPWVRTKQAYPGVSVLLLAAGGKVLAVIAIERSDIMVGVGTIENGALTIRQ